jgi:VCBS repeat protein/dockerin type I repeat protein
MKIPLASSGSIHQPALPGWTIPIVILLGMISPVDAADCNHNGIDDSLDITRGTSQDCNKNGTPDECDLKPTTVFNLPDSVSVGESAYSVVSGDFDGDSRLDMAVSTDDHLEVILSKSDHSFVTRSSPTFGGSSVLQAADLDGDGASDIASGGFGSIAIYRNMNDGKPSFSFFATADIGETSSLAAADFEGDGKVDLAATNESLHALYIVSNKGRGNFPIVASFDLGDRAYCAVPLDVDRDGWIDLAASHGESGAIAIFRNDGKGSFEPATSFPLMTNGKRAERPISLASIDIDGDGDPDLATANQVSQDVSVIENSGGGDWHVKAVISMGGPLRAIGAKDLDLDGSIDLAVIDDAGSLSILENRSGSFDRLAELTLTATPFSLAIGDFDGNSVPDLAVASLFSGSVAVLWNPGKEHLDFGQDIAVGSQPIALAMVDLDGDGNQDLVGLNHESNDLSILLATGQGAFRRSRLPTGTSPTAIDVGDLDGDGRPDIAVTCELDPLKPGSLQVSRNEGGGGLANPITYQVGRFPTSVVIGDFDGDERPDLITSNMSEFNITVLKGEDGGSFGRSATFPAGKYPSSIQAADFDGDGNLDIAATNTELDLPQGSLSVLLNNGDGAFRAPLGLVVPREPRGLVAGDFDGDGKIDLACMDYQYPNPSNIVLAFNKEGGGFEPYQTLPTSGVAFQLTAADLDGDAALDLIVADAGAGSVSLWLNAGGRMLTRVRSVPVGRFPVFVFAGDFDGDGFPDVASANTQSDSISIRLLHQEFVPPSSSDDNQNSIPDVCERTFFHRGDGNGDGVLDVSDAVCMIQYLFTGQSPAGGGRVLRCLEAADSNNDGAIDCSDAVFVFNYMFLGGDAPASPGPPPHPCGPDSDPLGSNGDLGCDTYSRC